MTAPDRPGPGAPQPEPFAGRWPNAVLVGARASGKSRASRRFAAATGWTLVSTDDLFEERHGPIPEFVARFGWERFRDEESRILGGITGERLVVDCGGGIVLRRENREAIRRLGTAYWLRAPLPVLRARLSRAKGRRNRPPLLGSPDSADRGDPAAEAAAVLAQRAPLYRQVADFDLWSAAPTDPEEPPGASERPAAGPPAETDAAVALREIHFGPGIALSVAASTAEQATAGLLAAWEQTGPDDLLELRLDHLERAEPAVLPRILDPLPPAALGRLIATVRRREEGGRFPGSETARVRLLVEAARLGVGWLDLEAEADRAVSPPISEQARRANPAVRLIASHHDFAGIPDDLENLPARLAALRPALVKVAAAASGFEEVARIHRLLRAGAASPIDRPSADRPSAAERSDAAPPLVAVALGEAGRGLRVTARAAGARLSTYAPPAGWPTAAPGQRDAEAIRSRHRRWGANLAAPVPVFGVVGFPVAQSLSPAMHEAAFRHLGIEAAYRPFAVPPDELAEFLTAARLAEVAGLNLTIPHKRAATALLDGLDAEAQRIGAVNTILRAEPGGRDFVGANTDWIGAVEAIEEATPLRGRRVSLLGAGGSARAVLYGVRRRGAEAVVYARNDRRAAALADDFGARAARWADLPAAEGDLLVNTTPIGMALGPDPAGSPAPLSTVLGHRTVFDLVFHPRRTPLLEAAAGAGRAVVPGLRMLVRQAARAFTRWTGRPAPVEVMARAAKAADDAR